MIEKSKLAAGTGSSVLVDACQVCGHADLRSVIFLGYLPPVNEMRPIGVRPAEQPAYPAELLYCPHCNLVQIGLIVDPNLLFPPTYPYTSGTTKILRENFHELFEESRSLVPIGPNDLIIDVGSNDGTLLSNFKDNGHRVLGIEPTGVAELAKERGIPTVVSFFAAELARKVRVEQGPAKIVTATNVFAHMEDIHAVLDGVIALLEDDGVFISESHYLISLLETLQYDTIYHEHLRYYSLHSLQYLLQMHGLKVLHARRIPTHGGSLRVYAVKSGDQPVLPSVTDLLEEEKAKWLGYDKLADFKRRVLNSKLDLYGLLLDIKKRGHRICGISAPSRASTLINYVGLDDGILEYVLEVSGSLKIGKYMPGTLIPVHEESRLFEEQPEYAIILSWHIANELIPKLARKGYKGKFIVPLPTPAVVGSR